ncbi:hypothetical protein ACVI1J_002469 [Bradyrhizobium diazoefficiens]
MNLFLVTCRALENLDQAASRYVVADVIVGEPCKADARDCHSPQALSVVCEQRAADCPVGNSPALLQRPDRGRAPEIESQAVVT